MTTKPAPEKPLFRVTFSRIEKDDTGKDVVLRPKEIGAVWPRKNGKQGGILTLDHIPVELAQRRGVVFLIPTNQDDGGSQ